MIQHRLGVFNLSEKELRPQGTTRKEMVHGSVYKTANESWIPTTTRNRDDYPSLVVEIGVLESYERLKTDARIWLDASDKRTRIVLLVVLDLEKLEIRIERWERAMVQRRIVTRSVTARMGGPARCIQRIILTRVGPGNVTVTGAPLVLPLATIFDGDGIPPLSSDVDVDNELSFSAQMLEQMAIRYFAAF
ncbi:uncharacterized protein BO80DRAFT_193778 [Aspergillus ibericus CBS 121593]|uniref:Uncharacterized protein n=1 Tax=Aspergillus ibericus CBS 121593 TaxID=1448316 RepID=A0A395GPL5_9EURO|nr:hypothetical protein BO80DRAFT_193778 [Aspergillus ibericus CBS 121593]RAK97294.1 hypothetical protein BO80DRAFT_193778 [Aspergillus ibericus CBS 121593]